MSKGSSRDGGQQVTLVLNLLLDDPGKSAIHVADPTDAGITCWLPRSQIRIEESSSGSGLGRPQGRHGSTLRVTMPLWLARAKNLHAAASAEQGNLF